MIYDSVDTIPSKIFFKILSTGDVNLLTDELDHEYDLKEIWKNIEAQDSELHQNKESNKELNLDKQIESLLAKIQSVILSVFHLRIIKDHDLIELLKKDGYKIDWDESKISDEKIADQIFQSQLDTVERESEALNLKVSNLQRQLEKIRPSGEKGKHTPFDEVVMGYGVVSGWMVRPNDITQSEYRALIKIGNQKMKSLENAVKLNGKR